METNNKFLVKKQSVIRQLVGFLLKIFFKLLYHRLSWTYDWVASIVSLGEWKAWGLSSLAYIAGPRSLEIGFGPGHLQVALHQKGITSFGLDASIQMCRLAHKRLLRSGFHPNLIRGLAQYLPFRDASLDQVVMTFPSEFIFNPSTFTEIDRVLTDSGTVVVIPWARITGKKPHQRAIAWLNRITGEAPDWDENSLALLTLKGFETGWEIRNFPFSQVLLLKLTKRSREELTKS